MSDKCKRCGACKECGAVTTPYVPFYPYWSVVPPVYSPPTYPYGKTTWTVTTNNLGGTSPQAMC